MAAVNAPQVWTLIVDDDPVVLESLEAYFKSSHHIRVVAKAANGLEALAVLRNVSVDVVVADIHMPEMDGLSLLREIKKLPDPPKFVAITALDTDETMLEILANGGAGYITKTALPTEIIDAIRDANDGGTSVSPHALTRLVSYMSSGLGRVASAPQVTAVEREVLRCLCEGMTNAQIADELSYTESTVKKYISQLLQRFDAGSRLSLALKAKESGF